MTIIASCPCLLLLMVSATLADRPDDKAGPAAPSEEDRSFRRPSLQSGIGGVDFPVRTESRLARLFFNQGMAMLYQREEREAERAFLPVAEIDPKCAMAYWGLVMANRGAPRRAARHIEKAMGMRNLRESSAIEYLLVDWFAADWQAGRGTLGRKEMLQAFGIGSVQGGDEEVEALCFCCSSGNVTDKVISDYIAGHMEDGDEDFTVEG